MPGSSRPILNPVRQNRRHAPPPAAPRPVRAMPVTDLCLSWFRAGACLDALTLAWSRVDAAQLTAGTPRPPELTNRMQRLERQIARIDRRRSSLMNRIVGRPASNPEEAVGKLLVAQALLEGEGGAEHDLVTDALARLTTDLGCALPAKPA